MEGNDLMPLMQMLKLVLLLQQQLMLCAQACEWQLFRHRW
jgi:hypothetical protein